tara:strand:+ start:328 stop:516 length:189 start_codon:yes stop_codon:yes gene_type:complete
MDKEQLIYKLTLLDASAFRCIAFAKTNKFNREPINFRNNLFDIYKKLDEKDLFELLKIKTKQ